MPSEQPRQGQTGNRSADETEMQTGKSAEPQSHRAVKDAGRGQNKSSEGFRMNYGLNNTFTNR